MNKKMLAMIMTPALSVVPAHAMMHAIFGSPVQYPKSDRVEYQRVSVPTEVIRDIDRDRDAEVKEKRAKAQEQVRQDSPRTLSRKLILSANESQLEVFIDAAQKKKCELYNKRLTDAAQEHAGFSVKQLEAQREQAELQRKHELTLQAARDKEQAESRASAERIAKMKSDAEAAGVKEFAIEIFAAWRAHKAGSSVSVVPTTTTTTTPAQTDFPETAEHKVTLSQSSVATLAQHFEQAQNG